MLAIIVAASSGSAQTAELRSAPATVSQPINAAVDVATIAASATADASSGARERGRHRRERARTVAEDAALERNRASEQANERERAALEKLEQARLREERERDDTLRELRMREREIAEKALAQTRSHSARLEEIGRVTQTHLDEIAETKAGLIDELDAIPPDASEKTRRASVDPLFDQLLELRSDAHDQFRKALREADEANQLLAELESEVAEAEARLVRARKRMDEFKSSELWERRVAIARARLEFARQRELHQREIVEAYGARVRDYHSQFGFFAGTIEPLFGRISEERLDAYFDLGDSANWRTAMEGLGTGARALEARVEHRLEQLDTSALATLEFWAWLWGLLWRLGGLLALAFLGMRALVWVVDRICAGLLRRRLLRRNAAFFVKLAEMLRAVSRPALYFVGIRFTAGYAARRIPELLGLVWIVDAIFIYWMVMQASRVATLPRSHRREEGEASADELDYVEESRADDIADITGVDLSRAKKLLRSIRVVTVFWLLAAYVPDFVKPLTGITIFWWLVDQAATWGFIAVVYWVLSSWRDEIAALFEKLAGERLAPAVAFVQRHKTRPWGVLVVGVTSLYVLFKEIALIMRRYVLETHLFKRLSALAFRTQIEMQNRSRSDAAADPAPPAERLDPDYLRFFERRPLDDESYVVARDEYAERIWDRFTAWESEHRRGSVVVSGEAGVGKTTLPNRVGRRLGQANTVVKTSVDERMTDRDALLSFLADAFDLDEQPADVTEFVEVARQLERRVVIIDDCHLLFSRHIERFDAIEALLEIVQLCDSRHFFVIAFARHAWRYIDRVADRGHCLGEVVELEAWDRESLQELIERRNAASGYSASFASLIAAHADTGDEREAFDVIETARGYFGYLHEFSGGIPHVAILYWLASLHPSARENVLDVDLFERPDTGLFATFSDDHWFILAALVQHGGLTVEQLAEIMDRSRGFCARTLDYFADNGVVELDGPRGRAVVSAHYWRPVLRRLAASKFVYGA